MSGGMNSAGFLEHVFTDSSISEAEGMHSQNAATGNKSPLRFDPFADTPAVEKQLSHSTTSIKRPHALKTDIAPVDKREEKNAIFSPSKTHQIKSESAGTLTINATKADVAGVSIQGMVLGRVSMRSLVMRDWTPFFYVVMANSDIRYYDDPHFLKHNNPANFSILIYRERSDFERNPMGTQIKRVIPIQPNYCCGEVKQKNYSAEYGDLFYFAMEELHELKNRPVAKFASNNRSDIDLMWMVLKCKIASAKKLQIENLIG